MNQNRKVNFQNYLFQQNKLITLIILSSLIIKLILKFFKLPQFYDVQTYIDTVNFF